MRLFGRKWEVIVGNLRVTELDMAFKIRKTNKPDPNTCELSIYNLSEQSRALLESSVPLPTSSFGIPTMIKAGYEEAQDRIWFGDLRTVNSFKNGPDWVTVVGSGDGEAAIRTARINQSFAEGTSGSTVLAALVTAMGLGPGNLGFATGLLAANPLAQTIASQGIVLSGSAADHLTDITDALGIEWSVQDQTIQFMARKQPVPGKTVLLTPETGLIDPPPTVDNDGILTCQMLMIPGVAPGTLLTLASERVQGIYRVIVAEYEGDTAGDPWFITVEAERYG